MGNQTPLLKGASGAQTPWAVSKPFISGQQRVKEEVDGILRVGGPAQEMWEVSG